MADCNLIKFNGVTYKEDEFKEKLRSGELVLSSQKVQEFDTSKYTAGDIERVQEKILKGFTKNAVLVPKYVGEVRIPNNFTTKTGKAVKTVAVAMSNWAAKIPDFGSARIEYSPVYNAIQIVPTSEQPSLGINTGSIVQPAYNASEGLTYSNFINPTSGADPAKTPAQNSFDKLIKSQSELDLDNTYDPKTGQQRHQYTLTRNGVKRDLGPSVTTRIEKKFNPREEDKDFNLSLANEGGTPIHKDLENEFKRYLTENFELNLITKDNTERNTPDHVFGTIRSFAAQLIEFYRAKNIAGLKIIPELRVVDELVDKGLGMPGTIDLFVLYPDNSYDKYDWKNIYNLSEKKRVDMSRRGYFAEQANSFADILAKAYGITDRRMDLMIPFNMLGKREYKDKGVGDKFHLENIEVAPFVFGQLDPTKMYLQPIVINYGETDDEDIQHYRIAIDKIIKQTLQEGKHGDDADIQSAAINADRLERALFDITFRRDVSTMTNEMCAELATIRSIIKNKAEGNELVRDIDLTKSVRRLDTFRKSNPFIESRLKDAREQVQKMQKALESDTLSEEDRSVLKDSIRITQDRLVKFSDTAYQVELVLKEIGDYAAKFAQQEYETTGFPVFNVNSPEVEIKFGDKHITIGSQVELANLQTILQKIHESIAKAELTREELTKPIIDDVKALKDSYKGDLIKLYEAKLIERTTTGFFRWRRPFEADFYEEKTKAAVIATSTNLEEGGIKWFKENTTFNRERFNRDIKTLEEKWDKLILLGKNTQEEKAIALEQHRIKFDTGDNFENVSALLLGEHGNKYVIANEKWFSPEYKAIQSNKDLKNLYDDCLALNFMLAERGMINEGLVPSFFPPIERNFSQAWQQGDKEGLKKLIGRMADAVTITDAELISQGDLDPLSGDAVLELRIANMAGIMPANRASADVGLCYEMLAEGLAVYDQFQEIEPDINLILLAEKNKRMFPVTARGQVSQTSVENTTNYNFTKGIVEFIMYGKDMGKDATVKVYSNFLSKWLQLDNKNLSFSKSVDAFLGFTVVRGLTFSLSAMLSNIVGGKGITSILAKTKQFFTTKNWLDAEILVLSRSAKYKAAMKFFLSRTEDTRTRELRKEASAKTLVPSFSRIGLSGMHLGDTDVQETITMALLQHQMFDENYNVVDIRQHLLRTPEGKALDSNKVEKEVARLSKEKSILALMKLDEKGNPYWLDADGNHIDMTTVKKGHQSNRTQIQRISKEISNRIIGAKTTDDPMGANLNPMTKPLFTYRSWISGIFNAMFKSVRYRTATKTYEEGRMRLFLEYFTHFKSSANILLSLFGADKFAPSVKAAADESYYKTKEQYEKAHPGKEFEMDEAEYLHQYVGTIASYSRNVMLLAGFLILAMLLKPDEDTDEETKAKMAFMSKFLKKFYGEFSFFFDPRSATQLLNNSVPAVSVLTDLIKFLGSITEEITAVITQNEDLAKKSKPLIKGLKFLPGTNQMLDIYALFDKDFRKANHIDYMPTAR